MIENNDPQRNTELTAAFRRLRHLPTLETQTIECFRILEDFGAEFRSPYTTTFDLRRGDFRLYAQSGFWIYSGQPLWGFTIANIAIPVRFWGRGWLRAFSEIVYHTMPHDFLLFQGVNPTLDSALSRKSEFHRFRGNWFVRAERIAAGSFQPLMLSESDYEEFIKSGGRVNSTRFSKAVTKFPGFTTPLTVGAMARAAAEQEKAAPSGPSAPEPEIPIEQMNPQKGAEHLMHCLHCGPAAHLEGMRRMAEAHPDEGFWLQMCEVWEQAKRRSDPLSGRVFKWREQFDQKKAAERVRPMTERFEDPG